MSEKDKMGTKLGVDRIFVHKDYSSSTVLNDIGLIRLNGSVRLNDCEAPIALPPKKQEYPVGMKCTTSGWGTTEEGGSLPDALRHVQVPLISDAKCAENYGEDSIFDSMICAGLKDGGKDSCQGDGRVIYFISWHL